MSGLRVGICVDPGEDPGSLAHGPAVDILLFPELFDGGYASLGKGKPPHTSTSPLLQSLRKFSKGSSATLIAGSTYLHSSRGRGTNSSLVLRNGRTIHRYDKVHLFRPTGDARFFTAGSVSHTFRVHGKGLSLTAGIVICYDLRFPELIRSLAFRGARILFVPARWPQIRDDAWRSLLKARAIENQIFVVGCNARPPEGGYSYVFSPVGQELWSNRRRRQRIAVVSLDADLLRSSRAIHNNLQEAVYLRRLLARARR